ncbi:GTP cyclohydrolase FolE2 [Marinibactrum halimedae]|uniref:GTP cyclohydrolase FolE2 n=1 Tax=Marinibactrum halimedae TaxID=1444977 RepID=A0AA37WM13_9GAMM|nr:GTP cyclohydrolase FolE2 [Marinibactrum halimedae]MCD9459643.1 GTP cyclohydrolase FolE2 [Marinibactrum halimedae]GLS25670.1 GTP cyclohydrolase FolE2 [Marinibactrum halimedae]
MNQAVSPTDFPLPDVTSEESGEFSHTLNWVGMERIALPLRFPVSPFESASSECRAEPISAMADVFVGLDKPSVKGIHMSRLYLILNNMLAHQELNQSSIERVLASLIESQQGISRSAKLCLRFEVTLKKPALLSEQFGYQSYPVQWIFTQKGDQISTQLELTVPYSSTCPCSASLSRQLMKQAMDRQFTGESVNKAEVLNWVESLAGSIATPHSQRSYAYLKLDFTSGALADITQLIKSIETAIGTPVQTAVKRQDEQAFAQLNAENLLFCEDAARRVKAALEAMDNLSHYWFKVEHQESLHAHNAVVIDQKS